MNHRLRVGVAAAAALTLLSSAAVAARAASMGATPSPSPSAVAAPAGSLKHAGRWIVDGKRRVVVIHGVNVPSKWAPATYPAALNFADDDAALLAASGMNAVRLTVERYAVEPTAGHFDDSYVARVRSTVRLLAGYGIRSLIDFHQDEWGPVFADNGFPDWMTVTDGLPNVDQVGFPGQYFANPALNRAFDHFWANDTGPSGRHLQDDDADILAHVAYGLKGENGVMGYEVMNEPWPGTQYPTCAAPGVGCPVFDKGAYSAYYARVIPKIRIADPHHAVWYEPLTTFNEGVPTSVTPPRDTNLGFAFHDYSGCSEYAGAAPAGSPKPPNALCQQLDDKVMNNAEAHSRETGSALLETEFGANSDTDGTAHQLDVFDHHMMPWMFWSYTNYVVAVNGNGSLKPASGSNVNSAMLSTLARPYPQLVSGTPKDWSFDTATRTFSFHYSPRRADGRGSFAVDAETDIAVPAIVYGGGYKAWVLGGTVLSKPNAPLLRVRARGRASSISVTIVPAARIAATNSQCPPGAISAGGVAGVDGAPSRSGPSKVTGCLAGTGVADGTVTAEGNPSNGDGYVVQDGRPSNPGLLAGYLGVDRQHALTLVGCAGGDYKPGATDDWNQSPTGAENNAMAAVGTPTFTAPSGPVGPSSPCSPPVVPAPAQGSACGSPPDPSPAATAPGNGSPLNAYYGGFPTGDAGLAGDFGGNDGASGYAQATANGRSSGNVTVGGTSKGGGGTVAAGNDGNETKDRWTPDGSPFALCQD
ncbi:MAG: cellulase family glycosylhydrolase [Acidimicrobiia bacterium]|nr:cellulase family glycosylhydrolase [Acidimicrobiia bacterium]